MKAGWYKGSDLRREREPENAASESGRAHQQYRLKRLKHGEPVPKNYVSLK